MSIDDPTHGMSFSALVFSDLHRFRPHARPSWGSVLVRVPSTPGMIASIVMRAQQCLCRAGHAGLARQLTTLGVWLVGIDIAAGAVAGPGLAFWHPSGVTLGHGTRLGANVTMAGGVTFGASQYDTRQDGEMTFPNVGDEVAIGAHAVLIGGVRVGANAVIGANSVVTDHVLPGAIVAGAPARQIGTRPSLPTSTTT